MLLFFFATLHLHLLCRRAHLHAIHIHSKARSPPTRRSILEPRPPLLPSSPSPTPLLSRDKEEGVWCAKKEKGEEEEEEEEEEEKALSGMDYSDPPSSFSPSLSPKKAQKARKHMNAYPRREWERERERGGQQHHSPPFPFSLSPLLTPRHLC